MSILSCCFFILLSIQIWFQQVEVLVGNRIAPSLEFLAQFSIFTMWKFGRKKMSNYTMMMIYNITEVFNCSGKALKNFLWSSPFRGGIGKWNWNFFTSVSCVCGHRWTRKQIIKREREFLARSFLRLFFYFANFTTTCFLERRKISCHKLVFDTNRRCITLSLKFHSMKSIIFRT